jgi:hypothetical protein
MSWFGNFDGSYICKSLARVVAYVLQVLGVDSNMVGKSFSSRQIVFEYKCKIWFWFVVFVNSLWSIDGWLRVTTHVMQRGLGTKIVCGLNFGVMWHW